MLNRQLALHTVLLGFSLVSMQGVIYLLQILAAQSLPAPDFNFVRITESLTAIVSLLIAFGLPSVALVWGERTRTPSGRRRLLQLGGGFMLAMVLIVYLASVTVLTDWVAPQPEQASIASSWSLPHFIAIASLMSFRLLLSAMLQSRQRYVLLAAGTAAAGLAALAVGAVVLVLAENGVLAWLAARYTLECVACATFLISELIPSRSQAESTASPFSARELFAAAFPVGGGTALRALVEHGPLLALAAIGASAIVLSEVGITVTAITVSIILVGIVQGVLVPMLSRSMTASALRSAGLLAGVAIAGSLVVLAVLSVLLEWTSPHAPFGDLIVVIVVAGIVVTKSMASFSGGLLLVLGRMRLILLLNIAVFAVLAGAFAFSQPDISTTHALGLILLVEGFGAVIYALAVLAAIRRRSGDLTALASGLRDKASLEESCPKR